MARSDRSTLSFTSVNRSGCTNVTESRDAASGAAGRLAAEQPSVETDAR